MRRLIDVMAKGGTINWLEALERITGKRKFARL